ncbi:MAG TPA: hypothetical protein VHT75_17795 [Acidimicrobiales bacterium]|nr:hypothetical protein [Acidimicrobiales bacterium]
MVRKRGIPLLLAALVVAAGLAAAVPALAVTGPRALLVGTWAGRAGQYATIQAAVDAARPGDWVLVGPGDYRSDPSSTAGVLITTPGIHLRGMDRNGVVVDGTTGNCSPSAAAQTRGPAGAGRNGVEILRASGVTVDNLTVCNFLDGAGGHNGNQVWFNGGDGSGRIGLGAYEASYVTATSTFYAGATAPLALYGSSPATPTAPD